MFEFLVADRNPGFVLAWPPRDDSLRGSESSLPWRSFSSQGLPFCSPGCTSRAGVDDGDGEDSDNARQVTVFGVLATPNAKTVDSRLSNIIQSQFEKLLPKNGFKLLDARTGCIVDGESITCNLGHGYSLTTLLVKPLDESGKVELRCELFHDKVSEFATLVKTPLDQLFFCRRELSDGTQFLIGVGARC